MPWGTSEHYTDVIVHMVLNDTDYANSPLVDTIRPESLKIEILTKDDRRIPLIFGREFDVSSSTPGLFEITIEIPHRITNHTLQIDDKLNIIYFDAAGDRNIPVPVKSTVGFFLSNGILKNAAGDNDYAHGEFIYMLLEDIDLNLDSKTVDTHVRPIYFIRDGERRPSISDFKKSPPGVLFKDVIDVHRVEFKETGKNTGVFETTYRMPKYVKNTTLQNNEIVEVQYLDYGKNDSQKHVGFDAICCYIETWKSVKFELKSRGQYCTGGYVYKDGLCWPDLPREKHLASEAAFSGVGEDATDEELTQRATGLLNIIEFEIKQHSKEQREPWFNKYTFKALFKYDDYGELPVAHIVRVTGDDKDTTYRSATTFSTERTYESVVLGEPLPPGTYEVEMVGSFIRDGRQVYTEPVSDELIVPGKP